MYNYDLKVGDDVVFFEGRRGRSIAYSPSGKVVLCNHPIELGFAKIKIVEERDRFYLVTADHIVKDVYKDIVYEEFMEVLKLFNYKVGLDTLFTGMNGTDEHFIYAYNLEFNTIIVAETFTRSYEDKLRFNSIKVYLPGVSCRDFIRSSVFSSGSESYVMLDLAFAQTRTSSYLEMVKKCMSRVELRRYPKDFYPILWDYTESIGLNNEGTTNLGKRCLNKLLLVPESLQIFEGCSWLPELKEKIQILDL